MNKIPLSGFCLLLKSRHKHLFRIMRITYMLLFAAIFCLHAENAISQKEGVSKFSPSFFMPKAPTFTSWGFVIT